MDNARCHPHNLADTFSNITIKFPSKNTTSMTQPHDAGIMANCKVKYKSKLLRFVCSRVEGKKNASEIVKSVNVSMAIERGQSSGESRRGMKCRQAWLSSASKKRNFTLKK